MLVRIWHGRVHTSRAAEYLHLMRTVALPDYRAAKGNAGAWCLRRDDGDLVHFEMLTYWRDLEAMKRFAGEDVTRAKYYDFDQHFLLELEPRVQLYEAYDA